MDFEKLPKKHQALLVAFDVLKQVEQQKYPSQKIDHGSYFRLSEDKFSELCSQKITKKELKETTCYVCAKGAAMLSYFRRLEKLPNIDFNILDERANPVSRQVFGPVTADKIEYLFERGNYGSWPSSGEDFIVQNPPDFWKEFDNSEERLRQIMRNYLFNKGRINLKKHPAECVIFHLNKNNNKVIIIGNETMRF